MVNYAVEQLLMLFHQWYPESINVAIIIADTEMKLSGFIEPDANSDNSDLSLSSSSG